MSVETTGYRPYDPPIDQSPCDGCTVCMDRCTAGIPLTRDEYVALRTALEAVPQDERDRVIGQEKVRPWPGVEDVTYTACRFLDLDSGLCLVYEARPLICRLFGQVEWLPCPSGKVTTAWSGGPDEMRARVGVEQHTWEEWEALSTR